MRMNSVFIIVQILVSVGLIGAILLQAQGTGLGSSWGGGGETYRSKRGVEKILLFITIILTILFLIISVVNLTS